MKVLVDEHLPPALARSLHALFDGEHQIEHVRDKFGPGVTDIKWIESLNAEGRWIVISADRRITRNRAEYTAFSQSKLIGFFMSKSVYRFARQTGGKNIVVVGGDLRNRRKS